MPTIRLDNVSKLYRLGEFEHWAVQGIDLTVEQGDFLFLVGSRGAGKSTLLNIMAGLMKPNLGRVFIDDADVNELKPKEREKAFSVVSCIRQGADLNRAETVYDNMSEEVRQFFFFRRRVVNKPLVDKALGIVGVPESGDTFPRDLSSSECRRVLIAKAILNSPAVLLLDDFTDHMDEDTIWDMLHLLNELNRKGTTIIMSTNSSYVVNIMRRRVVTLADGKLVGDVKRGRYGYI
ncbi:MAG: ATP-binding cassette domain-containing protein [Oscillibacter sp.]|nr:ATP-binding cassette domain-containing protein [Oscillibacter sp.]MBQ7681877.1 ATP-binding cassette domain-containing protein [Oscillibacter sp.]